MADAFTMERWQRLRAMLDADEARAWKRELMAIMEALSSAKALAIASDPDGEGRRAFVGTFEGCHVWIEVPGEVDHG